MEAGHYTSWNSPSTTSLYDIFGWANDTFTDDMINAGCDVLAVMTGISDSQVVGLSQYEELALRTRYEPQANTFQHEASHFYNCPDNQCSSEKPLYHDLHILLATTQRLVLKLHIKNI